MSEQKTRVEIRQMLTGFTVLAVPAKEGESYVGLAGCSSFDDLIDWLAAHFGILDERHTKSVNLENLFAAKQRHVGRNEKPDDFDWHRIPDETAPVPESEPEGEAIGDTPAAFASIDQLRAELEGKMGDARGAQTAGPEARGVSTMAPVAEAATEAVRDADVELARTAAVVAAEDAPETERDRIIAELPDKQAALLDTLELLALEAGTNRVSIRRSALATRAGVKAGSMKYLLTELTSKGLVAERSDASGVPTFTVVGMKVDDDGEA